MSSNFSIYTHHLGLLLIHLQATFDHWLHNYYRSSVFNSDLSNLACSIVGAIRTKSSVYINSEGRPLLTSMGTTSMTTANSSNTDP